MSSELQARIRDSMSAHKETLSSIGTSIFGDGKYLKELGELFTSVISAEWRPEGKELEEMMYSPEEAWGAARDALQGYLLNAYFTGFMQGTGWVSGQDAEEFSSELGEGFADGLRRTAEKLGRESKSRGRSYADGFTAVMARGASEGRQRGKG